MAEIVREVPSSNGTLLRTAVDEGFTAIGLVVIGRSWSSKLLGNPLMLVTYCRPRSSHDDPLGLGSSVDARATCLGGVEGRAPETDKEIVIPLEVLLYGVSESFGVPSCTPSAIGMRPTADGCTGLVDLVARLLPLPPSAGPFCGSGLCLLLDGSTEGLRSCSCAA